MYRDIWFAIIYKIQHEIDLTRPQACMTMIPSGGFTKNLLPFEASRVRRQTRQRFPSCLHKSMISSVLLSLRYSATTHI